MHQPATGARRRRWESPTGYFNATSIRLGYGHTHPQISLCPPTQEGNRGWKLYIGQMFRYFHNGLPCNIGHQKQRLCNNTRYVLRSFFKWSSSAAGSAKAGLNRPAKESRVKKTRSCVRLFRTQYVTKIERRWGLYHRGR